MTPVSHAAPLRADCIADSAGGLTFDVTAAGATETAHLVLRHREGREEVTLPLTPATKGRLRAALPSSVALPEGHWDAYARVTDEEPHRLAPGAMKVDSLASRVPYETRQGNLSVECRLAATPSTGAELCRSVAPPRGATSHNGPALALEPVPPSY
ncbi:hypothetical protein ACM01_19075 [Streptomyces viridochromogenes]|uniref:Transferase n=1 Tax=Streptomyces viridochromogenes TaxID=1938 RepID=A0A0J7ZBW4_STRVR|nr:hypothetical protein ACM01_19075 [Streptomyces viridochromogenes]KOG24391.1 hypothetical protein ADK35_11020 [Streptomyces viridochromogenes]KOG25496.1 hypothetical protein ADK36_05400 [Streptomyces viridochromogenes]